MLKLGGNHGIEANLVRGSLPNIKNRQSSAPIPYLWACLQAYARGPQPANKRYRTTVPMDL